MYLVSENSAWKNPKKDGKLLFAESVKEIYKNVNIYEISKCYPPGVNALFYALNKNQKKIASKILDIFEKDLKVLVEWNLSSAFVVQDQLLISEILLVCEEEFVVGLEPVLCKLESLEESKIVFLRTKLRDRQDPSLQLLDKIRENGVCDINWQPQSLYGDTYLHYAAFHGMTEIVERLLNNPLIKSQTKNSKRQTPLHYACFAGSYDSALLLASREDSIDFWERDDNQNNYALMAAHGGNQKLAKYIIDKMLNATGLVAQWIAHKYLMKYQRNYDSEGDRFVHIAAKSGHYNLITRSIILFDQFACLQNNQGETILHILAKNIYGPREDLTEMMEKLVKKFPELLLIEDKNGYLPLHIAVSYAYNVDFVKSLWVLTCKATGDDKIFSKDPKIALRLMDSVIDKSCVTILRFIIGESQHLLKEFGVRLLSRLCSQLFGSQEDVEIISFFLSLHKIDPNEIYNGRSAFLEAAASLDETNYYTDSVQLVRAKLRILMEHEDIKNINEVDGEGNSLLMYLVKEFGMDCGLLKKLVALEADLSIINEQNNSLLHQAAYYSNPDVAEWLLSLNVDTQLINSKGEKAITLAAEKGLHQLFQMLLPFESASELNRQNIKGNTLLHILMNQYNEKMLLELLALKVDVTIRNKAGDLPHHCSASLKNFEILHKHCQQEGIELDINSMNDNMFSCLTDRYGSYRSDIAKYITKKFSSKLDYDMRFNNNMNFLHYFCTAGFDELENLLNDEIFQEKCVKKLVNEKDNNGQTPLDYALETDRMLTYKKKIDNISFPLHLLSKNDLVKNLNKIVLQSRMILLEKVHSLHSTIFQENPSCLITAIKHVTDFEVIFFILEKIDENDLKELHILHRICEKNNKKIIDLFIKKIEDNQLSCLNSVEDENGKRPFELLNETNKCIFEAVFS